MSGSYCPAGFDCIYQNSCPAPVVACPAGFLCNTYANSPYKDDIDFQYAILSQKNAVSVTITKQNYKDYIENGRYLQFPCISGYQCKNSSSIDTCGTGNWCSERSVVADTCDPLSVCSTNSNAFQVNFVNILIAFLLTVW
jgi:hypothetical protein